MIRSGEPIRPAARRSRCAVDAAVARRRSAFTLIEILISLGVMSILFIGIAGSIVIATQAVDPGTSTAARVDQGSTAVDRLLEDLRLAVEIQDHTRSSVTFTVPDRDEPPDKTLETIRYTWSGASGDPLVRTINGGRAAKVAADVHRFEVTSLSRTLSPGILVSATPDPNGWGWYDAGAEPAIRVLLVVDDDTALVAGDVDRKTLLESWGFDVRLIAASATQATFDLAVALVDVALVAEQAGSVALGRKLRDATIGVVNGEIELHQDFGFSDARDWPPAADSIEVIDDTHEVTEPFDPGTLRICTTAQPMVALTGTPAAGLIVLGEHAWNGGRPALSIIATGADLNGGGTAAGRRVQLPWGVAGFDVNRLTNEGRTLMHRAITWAATSDGAGSDVLGYDEVFGTPVSNVRRVQVATQALLAVNGTVSEMTAYVGGAKKDCRVAIYSDAGDEPDTLLVESGTFKTTDADGWITVPLPATALAAGRYWIALAMSNVDQRYHSGAGGRTRYVNHDAVANGFLASWGTSDDNFVIRVSIYATCTPG